MTAQTQLSDLADAIIDGYWILCEPAEVVARAIDEFAEYNRLGRPFTFEEKPVDPIDFIKALEEVINYYKGRNLWPIDKEESK
ncbi:MAG: hypothetical protein ACO395_04685 [Pontimonas sp.]|jgi:hypothetical protein